jgi:hypothetical protein
MGNTNKVIAMAPGALQLVTYAKNQGQFQYEFEDQMRTTVVDPWLGLTHDVYMSYVKCNEEIELYIQFVTNWAVVGMPKCWADDDCLFEGVTDVFCYTVVCADTGYCDIEPACGTALEPELTDAVLCTSADLCPVTSVELFTFADNNNNDIFDAGDAALANVKVNVYQDYAQTILVDSQISNVSGNAIFSLGAGTYYVDIDMTYGAATTRVLNITLPWVLIIDQSGSILYPGWVENGNLPLGD